MIKILKLLLLTLLSSSLYGQNALVWDFKTNGGVYSSPVVDNSNIYIGSNDSCLYVLDKVSGQLKSKFKTQGEIKSRPLLYQNTVIFNSSDGNIYAINKENAELKWTFKTEGENRKDMWDYYLSSPIIGSEKLFIGSGDGYVYSLNPNDGKIIWKFKTDGIVHATPLVHGDNVFIGSFDGYFYSINADNGSLIWKFKTVGDAYFPQGGIQKGATLYKNTVIFGSRDYNIYSLNIETGRGVWNMKEKGSWVIATPLVIDNKIYVGTSDSHRFCSLSAIDGSETSSYPINMRVYGSAIHYNNNIYFGCFNGKLYQIDSAKGKLKEIFQTYGSRDNYHSVFNKKEHFKSDFELYGQDLEGSEKKILNLGSILSTPVVDHGIVYFGDSNGYIYALKLGKKAM
ncbi:PQQ-binding-like beta-propeller repeat protein [Flammeovirga sp. MY04]|uniref:outer membrane protein assembly factor BamB family protein n=1 Tax=Flammeovirga sp. MY04 TaxID=1191459 RepID=UPI0008063A94|nr:PQQ-binding-like beta-propeller repeat protein [Flammeovirga sp. MY04]ANQ49556.1 PQQ-binding-like beta-propeller repeat protein [Flammeovirga sp. MY04]